MTKQVIGIDVGKARLDVGVNDEKRVREWSNDETGRAALSDWVMTQEVELVVVEASGGYEAALVSELVERGQAVALVNPTRVRAFARAEGLLAKTDQIDARLIARFGAIMKPEPQARRDQVQVELNQWVTRRRQLTVYRCTACQGIYNLYSRTVFEGRYFRPAQAVLLLRGSSKATRAPRLPVKSGSVGKRCWKYAEKYKPMPNNTNLSPP